MNQEDGKYPEGYFISLWMGLGIAIFSGLGIPLSITTDNYGFIGVGPALGVAVGLAIGSSIEAKHKKEGNIRPLTEKEQKTRETAVKIGVLALILLVILGLVFLILRA